MKSKFIPYYGYSTVLTLLSLCCIPNVTHAYNTPSVLQQDQLKVTITGIVQDSDGVLPGVVIQVKDKNIATISDADGRYSIQASPSETLVYSFMGYTTKQELIGNKRIINLTLEQNSQQLDEITVNAGYYSVKERELTGSIATVTAKEIEFQPVIDPIQALQGRVAGLDITQMTGVPGGSVNVEIRGRNFLGSGKFQNAPLYIINGVPIASDNIGAESSNLNQLIFPRGISPLNSIPTSDIESIEILKDADATAIYGSRGANGVILITTKSGKQGETKFTVSSSLGFSKVLKHMDMMNTEQYLQMRKEAFANSGLTSYGPTDYDINGTWDQTRDVNWQKELVGRTATDQTISLGISGGNELANFNINLSHNDTKTVFPTDQGYKRNAVLINYNQRTRNNKLKVNSTVNYSDQSNNLPVVNLYQEALKLAPNAPNLYDEHGEINWENGTFQNPIAQLNRIYKNSIQSLVLNTSLSYNILPSLSLTVNTGITTTAFTEQDLRPSSLFNPALGYTSESSVSTKNTNNSSSYIIEPQLNYTNQWNKNNISFLAGISYQETNKDFIWLQGSNFSSDSFIKNISAAKVKNIGTDTSTQYKYASIFMRLNYIYNQKYIINLTARRDGSSRFAKNNKFGNFGAVGVAWILSKENFAKNWKWLSFAKLRSSYGVTGNDNIGDYSYLDVYNINNALYGNEVNLQPTALYNPDYRWEKTDKFEVALELSFLKDRLNTTVAYYNNRSGNQLVGYTLPSTTGFDRITTNFPALVENAGWEFTLHSTNIQTTNFRWTTSFNISANKNKLVSYPGLEEGTQSSTYIVGKSLNIIKLFNYEGIDPVTKNYIFTDYNGDGILNTADRTIIKDLTPKFFGGLQNSISYKNLSLDFLFQFVKKQNWNQDKTTNALPGAYLVNVPTTLLDRWSPDNLESRYLQASHWRTTSGTQVTNYKNSTASVSDGSYIRLKNISLSYQFSLPKYKIENIRIYVQGQNLWTITNYFGLDPEFTLNGFLPPLKTYSLGLQLTF